LSDVVEGLLLIAALAIGTYGLRIGCHLVLSRLGRLDPRVEAALDAVPAAVMTAIVAPLAFATGAAEAVAAIVTAIASLRLPILGALVIGVGTVVALRAAGL
jgi:uncharacterized membrane protein